MELTKLRSIVLVLALTAATVLMVALALQKRDLLARVEGLTTRIRDPYVGMYVPAATLPSVSGDSVLLGQAPHGQVQVLFVFSTSCEFYKASLPAWKRIAGELAGNARVEVVGISVDSVEATRRYVAEHGIDLPVVSFTDRRLRALYRAEITPQTLIIDAEGKVSFTRTGAVTETGAVDSIVNAVTTVAARVLEGRPNAATAH